MTLSVWYRPSALILSRVRDPNQQAFLYIGDFADSDFVCLMVVPIRPPTPCGTPRN